MNIPPAVKRAHLDTQRRLLEAERAAQARLAAAARDALAGHPGASSAAIRKASDAARDAVASEVSALRADARAAARATLAQELRTGGEEARQPAIARFTLVPATPALADDIAGQRVGNDYAAAWLARATDDGPDAATLAIRYRLNTAAGAEVGQAFGTERDVALKRMAKHMGPELSGVIVIVKVWDARLDACPVCRKLDGQIRIIGLDYRGGAVPGLVHRRCRCISGVVIIPAAAITEAA